MADNENDANEQSEEVTKHDDGKVLKVIDDDVVTKDTVDIEHSNITQDQMREIEAGEFVTIKYIANKLDYTVSWITNLVKHGRIRAMKPFGGNWRIPMSEYNRITHEGIPPNKRTQKETKKVTEIEVHDPKVFKQPEEPIEIETKKENAFSWISKLVWGDK